MAARQLSDGNEEGQVLGQSASDKVGFYGATPVVQGAAVSDASDGTSAITAVNTLIDRLEALGLIAENS